MRHETSTMTEATIIIYKGVDCMDEKYKKVKELLEEHNQEHLLKQYERFDKEEDRQRFLNEILTINFSQMEELYKNSQSDPVFFKSKLEPVDYIDKSRLSPDKFLQYKRIGDEKIRSGKLAVLTMAGGQGTRLGFNGPKGEYDIGLKSHKSIFEILSDTITDAEKKYNVNIPWYIMTSDENNEETERFFKEKNFFNHKAGMVTFFKQGKMPMLSTDGKLLIDKKGFIKQAADGHGGVFNSMNREGILYDMKARGIEWVFISGVDNILVKPVDPVLIGLSESQNTLAAGKSLVKDNPHEKVGVFCKRNGRPSVIEYTEISKGMAEERLSNGELRYGESHILCNMFNIKALEKIAEVKLPYHTAFKKADYIDDNGNHIVPEKQNAYKYEAFLFDAFELLGNISIMRVKREEEFAPIKNAEGVDSPETARKLYINFHNKENDLEI